MEEYYNHNSRKVKKSFGGGELLEYVWRPFSGLVGLGKVIERKAALRPF